MSTTEDTTPLEWRCCALPEPPRAADAKPHWNFETLRGQLDATGTAGPATLSGGDYEVRLPELVPVLNQGASGTCTANATVTACGLITALATGRAPEAGSRLFTYYQSRLTQGEDAVHRDDGTYFPLVLDSLRRDGMCPESLWPFYMARLFLPPTAECYVAATSNRLAAYYRIESTNEDRLADIRRALDTQHPVVFATEVGDDWMRYRAGDGDAPFALPTRSRGRHAMVFWGYRRRGDRWGYLVRNSWGTGWGLGGYGWMDETYVAASLTGDLWVPTQVPPLRSFSTTTSTPVALEAPTEVPPPPAEPSEEDLAERLRDAFLDAPPSPPPPPPPRRRR